MQAIISFIKATFKSKSFYIRNISKEAFKQIKKNMHIGKMCN